MEINGSFNVQFEDAEAIARLHASAVANHVEQLNAETERWCWKAISQGEGNRVWRSAPEPHETPDMGTTYYFAILKPGEPAPGKGVIFGPFSKEKN